MDSTKKEVCTIQIMFPVDSDDQALDYKKKIAEILKDNDAAQIRFALSTMPVKPTVE